MEFGPHGALSGGADSHTVPVALNPGREFGDIRMSTTRMGWLQAAPRRRLVLGGAMLAVAAAAGLWAAQAALASSVLSVAVSTVISPPLASATQTMAVSTSADTTAVSSPAYALTASADGSGTMSVAPTSVPRGSSTTEAFTYTAAAGGLSGGKVTITVPSGWSAPSATSGTAGFTTASTGAVSVSGQTATVSNLTLASGATLTVTYGAGGGPSAALTPNTTGTNTFSAKEASASSGTLTALAASPVMTTT